MDFENVKSMRWPDISSEYYGKSPNTLSELKKFIKYMRNNPPLLQTTKEYQEYWGKNYEGDTLNPWKNFAPLTKLKYLRQLAEKNEEMLKNPPFYPEEKSREHGEYPIYIGYFIIAEKQTKQFFIDNYNQFYEKYKDYKNSFRARGALTPIEAENVIKQIISENPRLENTIPKPLKSYQENIKIPINKNEFIRGKRVVQLWTIPFYGDKLYRPSEQQILEIEYQKRMKKDKEESEKLIEFREKSSRWDSTGRYQI